VFLGHSCIIAPSGIGERKMPRPEFDPENDFKPLPENKFNQAPPADERLANAAEYAAYQLGHIKVELRRIADALEKRQKDD